MSMLSYLLIYEKGLVFFLLLFFVLFFFCFVATVVVVSFSFYFSFFIALKNTMNYHNEFHIGQCRHFK